MNNAVLILRQERDKASEQMKALRVRVKELEAAIGLLEQQSPAPAASKRPEGDMKSLVVKILEASGPTGMFIKDIVAEVVKQGRNTTEPSVASTLSRLKTDERVGNERGMWIAAMHLRSNERDDDIDPFGNDPFADNGSNDDDDLDL
jgi:hypothetical protein